MSGSKHDWISITTDGEGRAMVRVHTDGKTDTYHGQVTHSSNNNDPNAQIVIDRVNQLRK